MKVILTEKVQALGTIGDIVNVSAGFGRNYLLPNRLAVMADDGNRKELENHKRSLAKKIAQEKNEASQKANKINGLTLEFVRKVAANGKLFGAISGVELAKVLAEKGIEVERRHLIIENPIKSIGKYKVKVKLFDGVDTQFSVHVTLDPVQAEELAKKSKAAKVEAEVAKTEEVVEMTQEEKHQAEAARILRG